jgi:hypothetical protein
MPLHELAITSVARISLDGEEYTSRNFKATRWRQSATIVLNDNRSEGWSSSIFKHHLRTPHEAKAQERQYHYLVTVELK